MVSAAKKPKASRDEKRVLAIVAQALEGEGPDAGGIGPVLRATAHLAECLAERLGIDVSAMVQERTDKWRATYGRLDLATDTRNFQMEALEELADCLFYSGAEVARRRSPVAGRRACTPETGVRVPPAASDMPEHEAWLDANPEALASVQRGLDQLGRGEYVPGPDVPDVPAR